MRGSLPGYKGHPYTAALWRQACEYLYAQSLVEAAAGKYRDQLLRLGEIDSAQVCAHGMCARKVCLVPRPFEGRAGLRTSSHTTRAQALSISASFPLPALPPSRSRLQASYHCASDELLARKLREQAAALVSKGKAATNTEDRDSDLHKALETLKELQECYEALHPEGSAKLAVSQADILQAQGEVYAALQQPNRAKTNFGDAKKIFASHLGPDHPRVKELEAKMQSTGGVSAAAAFRLSLNP